MPKGYLDYHDMLQLLDSFPDNTRLWWYSAYKYHLAFFIYCYKLSRFANQA